MSVTTTGSESSCLKTSWRSSSLLSTSSGIHSLSPDCWLVTSIFTWSPIWHRDIGCSTCILQPRIQASEMPELSEREAHKFEVLPVFGGRPRRRRNSRWREFHPVQFAGWGGVGVLGGRERVIFQGSPRRSGRGAKTALTARPKRVLPHAGAGMRKTRKQKLESRK